MSNIELMSPLRQRTWGWPAVINLTLGGTGSALYLFGAFFSVFSHHWLLDAQIISFKLMAPVIVCIGFLSLTMEAGKPLRAFRLFKNISHSWMSIESMAGAIFILLAFISYYFSMLYTVMASIAALVLMISQGVMVYRAVAIRAWNVKMVPLLLVSSSLTSAIALVLLNTQFHVRITELPLVLAIFCTVVNLVLWVIYIYGRREKESLEAVHLLKRPFPLILILGIGHLVPLVLLLSIFLSITTGAAIQPSLVSRYLSGLLLAVGAASQKTGIILAASYTRAIALQAVKSNSKSTWSA